MDVIKKIQPGEPGTKKLLEKYGQQLLCVRYRKDNQNQKRITTVELIVDDGFYLDPLTRRNSNTLFTPNRNVMVRITYRETELREKVKNAGAKWSPRYQRWVMRYRIAMELGLKERIEEMKNVDI